MAANESYLKHIWHPCTQMKDLEQFPPFDVAGAAGSRITLRDGSQLIDAISSWWCKSLGHQHPALRRALFEQAEQFEHVIFANTTNEVIVELSAALAGLSPFLNKVSYASDGSSAVEMAMKMSLHARQNKGDKQRKHFLALENGYHGETLATLSVSDCGIYRDPYAAALMPVTFLSPLPYVSSRADPMWENCEQQWRVIEKKLLPYAETATAIILEPILQGAGGMRVYSQDFLRRLRQWTEVHDVHLIADEIMTGIGRTGKMLACEHAHIEPDFLCLSKGLTSGWLPMSVMLTRQSIYDLFYDDYANKKSFLHSHTHSGNVLAAKIALQVLITMREEKILERVKPLGQLMRSYMDKIAQSTQKIINVRSIGAVVAADLVCDDPSRRLGYEVFQRAASLGALLRPLGNTIYWLPPLNIPFCDLAELKQITEQALLLVTR